MREAEEKQGGSQGPSVSWGARPHTGVSFSPKGLHDSGSVINRSGCVAVHRPEPLHRQEKRAAALKIRKPAWIRFTHQIWRRSVSFAHKHSHFSTVAALWSWRHFLASPMSVTGGWSFLCESGSRFHQGPKGVWRRVCARMENTANMADRDQGENTEEPLQRTLRNNRTEEKDPESAAEWVWDRRSGPGPRLATC